MILVVPNPSREVDFVILTSINYALAMVGGPVVEFSPTLNLKGVDQICICGHGGVGSIEHQPASVFANVLAHPVRGCKDSLKNLMLTCCYAGSRVKEKVGTAVIDIFASTLQINGMKIEGALGPSIKSSALGVAFSVVNKSVTSTSGRSAGDIQSEHLKATHEPKLANMITGDNRTLSWDKIINKTNSGVMKDGKPYVEYKAKKYNDLSANFFQNFVADLKNDGLLFDGGHTMRTVYWDGSNVVTVGESTGFKCYLTTATLHALGRDDAPELDTLRRFRDRVLLPTPSGRRVVADYYEVAPRIVAAIDRLPDSGRVYRSIYRDFIAPAALAVEAGEFGAAFERYRRLVGETSARFLGEHA